MYQKISKLLIACVFLIVSTAHTQTGSSRLSGPHLLVYKTRHDYRDLVPVILSPDKKSIVSYPSPADLVANEKYAAPVPLHKGYLLDQRGIGKDVAFLKMSYETYSKLSSSPSSADMMNMILDKNPLTFLCDCGTKYQNAEAVKRINELIDKGKLKKNCKVILH